MTNKVYIVVRQFTTQAHASPTDYYTEVVMDRDLYQESHGQPLFPVFTNKLKAQTVCDEYNSSDPYRKVNVIEVDLV